MAASERVLRSHAVTRFDHVAAIDWAATRRYLRLRCPLSVSIFLEDTEVIVDERTVAFKDYVIVPKAHQVGQPHAEAGRRCGSEYDSEKHTEESIAKSQFSHEPRFFDSEESAVKETVALAMRTIDRGRTGLRNINGDQPD